MSRWPHEGSPFHAGEQEVQTRLGVRDKIEAFARRVVRDHLPEQHREFYAELPFLLLGTLDAQGRPWASMVVGRPGFVTSPDARRLELAARPLFGDPLGNSLKDGAEIGVLGIQLETRRRNRLTGKIAAVGPEGFSIAVGQTFGNCPQYIQSRAVEVLPEVEDPGRRRPVSRADRFDERSLALIERADSLFIATAYAEDPSAPSQGADVSHRGGKPGFVRVEDERSLIFPDFAGNNHFNTVGNILLNPKAGLLLVDYGSGTLVTMTGSAEVVWEGGELRAFEGAERLIRFRAEEVIRIDESLPLRFDFGDTSPSLEQTGSWAQAAERLAAERERNLHRAYEVFDIRPESESILSFYLRRADGGPLAPHEPGQFLPIRVTVPGQAEPAVRTYTLSDAPNGRHYRLSVKREDGLVSSHLHDRLEIGDRLEAMAPRGKFVLDRSSERPVVMVSAGVGITPMVAMAQALIDEGRRTGSFRRVHFIHGARDGRSLAFAGQIRTLAAAHDGLRTHVRLSRPGAGDRLGVTHDSEGHVDLALLQELLPLDDYEVYLCGPPAFMQSLYDGLTGLGLRDERIHFESFGPATVMKRGRSDATAANGAPVTVAFSESGVQAEWRPETGTLLDLAESAGLAPAFSCRSGVCGTCATRMSCGQADYLEEPVAPHGDDEVLICCATPRPPSGAESCGAHQGVVLAL